MTDTRPNLEGLLGSWPLGLSCHCTHNSGPEQDCPEHGDVSLWASWAQGSHLQVLQLAQIVESLRSLSDELAAGSEREKEIGLEILQRLAQNVDLSQIPIWPTTPNDEDPF